MSSNEPRQVTDADRLAPERIWIRLPRLLVGLVMLAAVVHNIQQSITGGSETTLPQLFSMFTIQSSIAFGVVLIVSALVRRDRLPGWWDNLRGAVAFYMVMTGIVYALVVAPPGEFWSWDITWTNLVLHRLGPIVAFIDWLVVTMRRRAGLLRPLAWLAYPTAFLAFSWIRGGITGWYPYTFLSPQPPSDWPTVLIGTGVVLIAFVIVALCLHFLGNGRAGLSLRGDRSGRVQAARPEPGAHGTNR